MALVVLDNLKIWMLPPKSIMSLLTISFGLFVEYYASYNGSRAPEHNINAGFAYLLTPTLQLDISSGRTLWQEEPLYFIEAGFGLLIR